ncbi:MAG: shikimate kinase [Candidatus Hydrogenedentes bacterium]|nr:shikimate kinase [Candidatus Hydrogenedentota bacterium]
MGIIDKPYAFSDNASAQGLSIYPKTARGHIFFIGFMGVGKTTCSTKLALRLGVPHVELDTHIQQKAGKSIRRIFAEDGEEAFRAYEHQALCDAVASHTPSLISCGGGVVCHTPNQAMLCSEGYCILMEAAPKTILERLQNNLPPLLAVDNPLERILQLKQERQDAYECLADWVYDTTGKTVDTVCDDLYAHILSLNSVCVSA